MYRSMYGDKLEKVTKYRYEDEGLFESDVPIETRNLIDLYEDDDEPSTGHCVLNFDIEVSMEGELPDTERANNPITSIAYHDSCSNNYVVLVLDKEDKITDYSNDEVSVYSYDTERAMLEHFLDFYQEISPTILTGWNIDYFSVPYLYRRLARVLGQGDANRLGPIDTHIIISSRNALLSQVLVVWIILRCTRTLHLVLNQVIVWMQLVVKKLV